MWLDNIYNFIWKKPNENYIKWLFPKNKGALGNGLIFTLITVSALSLVDVIFYSGIFKTATETAAANLPIKEFEFDNFFRLIFAPFFNISMIFLAKSDWNNSMRKSEIIAGSVVFIHVMSFGFSNLYNENYNPADDFGYDILAIILFSQTLYGLIYRTTFIFNSILVGIFFLTLFYSDEELSDKVFVGTLVFLVWVPALSNSFKLEMSRWANYQAFTDLEKANEQIIQQENLLKNGEQVSKMASWYANSNMSHFHYTEGIYDIFELNKGTLSDYQISKVIEQMTHPEDRTILEEGKKNAKIGEKTSPIEYRVLLRCGKLKWLKVTIGQQIQNKGFFGTLRDITKEKQYENVLKEQAFELKSKNEELQQFVYASSHDLQEPLRSITNFVGLLDKKLGNQLTPEHRIFMDIIQNSTKRMKLLIHAILDYSRIGRNKELETFDCNEILTNILTDLHVAIEEADAKIHIENLPEIRAYKTEFSLLLQNLISNAIKFRKKNLTPVIFVRGLSTEREFQFCVQDNGIGINQKYANKIFQLFSRLHTVEEYKGAGIGLTHCKKIVELHGGKIWVESTENKGALFYFTIPKGLKTAEHEKETELHLVSR